MTNQINWIDFLNSIFLVYACILFSMYLFNAILSIFELRGYSNKNRYVNYKAMLSFEKLPLSRLLHRHTTKKRTLSIILNVYYHYNIKNLKLLL